MIARGFDQAMARVDPFLIGRVRVSNPSLKPCRQLDHLGFQESNDFALRFDEPRSSVIAATPYSPTANRASHLGTCLGGFAPSISARYGSHTATGAGSSSVML